MLGNMLPSALRRMSGAVKDIAVAEEKSYGFRCGHSCMRVFGVHPVVGLNYSASRLLFLLSGEF